MADPNYMLFVAAYDDEASAAADFETIKTLDDTSVVAAVVLSRDSSGTVDVKEHGGGLVAAAPPSEPSAGWWSDCSRLRSCWPVRWAPGSAQGWVRSRNVTRRRPSGSTRRNGCLSGASAIVAVVDDLYLDRVDAAVGKATKKVSKAIDKGDYDAVVKAVNEGDEKIIETATS